MTGSQTKLLVIVVLIEGALVLALFGGFPRTRASWKSRLYSFFLSQALAALLFGAGGYFQLTDYWFNQLLGRLRPVPFEPFVPVGDPGLRALALHPAPAVPRPNTPSPAAFVEWQKQLRSYLLREAFQAAEVRRLRDPAFTVLSSRRLGSGLVRQFVTFDGFDGTRIPGYLFVSAGARRKPAILVLSGHGNGIVETAGLVDSYQHGVALELAKAGYVTFTPESRGFGYLGSRINNEHRATAANAILAGSSFRSVLVRDLRRAIDVLSALPSVDSSRVGITGVSFGGAMSLTYAALDTRIRAVVIQGFASTYGEQRGHAHNDLGEADHLCWTMHGQNGHMAGEDLPLLIAPRPFLEVYGEGDITPSPAVKKVWRAVEESYRAMHRPQNYGRAIVPGGHEYHLTPALEFFRVHLSGEPPPRGLLTGN